MGMGKLLDFLILCLLEQKVTIYKLILKNAIKTNPLQEGATNDS